MTTDKIWVIFPKSNNRVIISVSALFERKRWRILIIVVKPASEKVVRIIVSFPSSSIGLKEPLLYCHSKKINPSSK